jgi:hypothetical protein
MNTSKSRPLAKVFWPVLLLTAALSLPVDSQAAPSPGSRNAHADRADKNVRKQEKKAERREAHQDRGRHLGQVQGQQNRAEARQRAELQRQAEIRRQAELQRQAQLQRQRQLQLQRQAELQRRASAQRYAVPRDRYYGSTADRYRNDNRYRNNGQYVSRYDRGDNIVVDGYLTNEGSSCQALRDDNGELYMLVGNTYGLRTGDHARVTGRVVDGGYCDWEGTAFEITDVKALWADRRHRSTYYHHQYDGESFGDRSRWLGRRPRPFDN